MAVVVLIGLLCGNVCRTVCVVWLIMRGSATNLSDNDKLNNR